MRRAAGDLRRGRIIRGRWFRRRTGVNNRAQIRMLPDGRRLHMHDGPIDVVVEAFGAISEIDVAYRAAAARFVGVLDELCCELEFLRRPACEDGDLPSGAIARRMLAAVWPFASRTFI